MANARAKPEEALTPLSVRPFGTDDTSRGETKGLPFFKYRKIKKYMKIDQQTGMVFERKNDVPKEFHVRLCYRILLDNAREKWMRCCK